MRLTRLHAAPRSSIACGSGSALITRAPSRLPVSRSPPHVTEPMPPEPPQTKPPIVAVRLVEGCIRSSHPAARRAWSNSSIRIPGCTRTAPSRIHSTRLRAVISTTAPPCSGTAWP